MILYQMKCSTTQQNMIQIVQISFVGCLETLPSMMKLRRRTPTCTTGSSSAALLVENLNLIHRTGMTFPLLVLRSGTEKLLIQTSNIFFNYFILFYFWCLTPQCLSSMSWSKRAGLQTYGCWPNAENYCTRCSFACMVSLHTNSWFLSETTPLLIFILFARIAGNGASEKNLKEGVCAQFEKNFAKAKWRVRGIALLAFLANSTINNKMNE